MITGGRRQARDEMFAVIHNATKDLGHKVIWQEDLEDADVNETVIMVAAQHLEGMQAAITQGLGKQRWESRGFLTVQIRVPVRRGGLTAIDDLATVIENALRGHATPNGVWFRDVVGRESPAKDGNAQTTVSAEFRYQEMT